MTQIDCPGEFDDPFRCPTKEEYLVQLMAMLPRGRAWQSHEAATSARITRYPDAPAECGEAECGAAQVGQVGLIVERTVLAAYWASYAGVHEFIAQRACQLLDEFFCETIRETLDVWADDYGFPDPCDPWEFLCEKVAAQGGATCDYITWAAARRGWEIACTDCGSAEPKAVVGCSFVGPWTYTCFDCQANTLNITIDVINSPAFVVYRNSPMAGCAMAGCSVLCGTNQQQIECLIERIKPAHVQAVYTYRNAHTLRSKGFSTGSPEIGAPGIDLDQLSTFDLETGSPEIEAPTLTEI